MIITNGVKAAKQSRSYNFITGQNRANVEPMSGASVFDATYGYGISTATSIVVTSNACGFADCTVTATMRYRAPTTAGAEYMGVFARMKSFADAGQQDYIFARQHQGNARIVEVVGGVFSSNLASTAYALPADEDVTIVLTCVGTAVSASFTCGSLGTVNLAGTTTVTSGGFNGFRTLSQVGWCSALSVVEL